MRDYEDVDIANVEGNIFQDDMKWTVNNDSDLCIPEDPAIKTAMDGVAYYDENTWERLDQHLVEEGEKPSSRGSRRWVSTHMYAGRRL